MEFLRSFLKRHFRDALAVQTSGDIAKCRPFFKAISSTDSFCRQSKVVRNNQQSKLLNEAEYELKYRADRGMPRKSPSKGLVSLFGLLEPILKPEREKNALQNTNV